MSETSVIAWFAAHPFTRNLSLAIVGAVSAAIEADRASYQKAKALDPAATFQWKVALVNYVQGGGMAAGVVLGTEVLHVLNVS